MFSFIIVLLRYAFDALKQLASTSYQIGGEDAEGSDQGSYRYLCQGVSMQIDADATDQTCDDDRDNRDAQGHDVGEPEVKQQGSDGQG